ncbi:FMN-binding glutamate synthase family protein [Rhodobacter capsulatus]|uniref:Glutamate synthase domain-containing protein 2 n=1 Tax=Rhodobacter capsulatus TaxID=1061 RepID=A0A0Q0QRD3_RHOCA|nr:FMN-binding glutamate synthase family protein [Rhodobacter capsulatus]KQB14279.1 glutamate synthase [Rhodobacter capsulatus]KQB17911.1 glutamate synthase [Rhodobacter capsulatus]PZX27121.1 glutamate synthase domain-containing protein 2 [Rhodobacter capsulatus]QNR64220.1 FMN-binding glutamate synthase family protein [Rhodobacter capsulatus]SDF28171.1 Glutamate synthase domain-containing protein 2 [Rhodobacter capsulatus]
MPKLRLNIRYIPFLAVLLLTGIFGLVLIFVPQLWVLAIFGIAAGLSLVGLYDLRQSRHAILRNYPVIGHLRYMIESVGPEFRQYFFESDRDEVPFSRQTRVLVYQRAKGVEDKRPFGTVESVYASGFNWLTHSIVPKTIKDTDFRVRVGGPDCAQPYDASVYNISAMSFGALSANAISALNRGAKLGGFAHDTGEGGISRYHRAGGGDLVYQVASGYFGCRNDDGSFSPEKFAAQARDPQIKMIEIKLSQGAKPGHGGMLPASKISPEIAEARGIPMGRDCVSPAAHSAFSTPLEFMAFIRQLRALSGGKPVGFKLCIGHRREFMCLVKAMLETGTTPDFIVVDGKEGGTGAAPLEFVNRVGMPMLEGLHFVHNLLRGAGLRDRIRIGAAGKIVSAYDIARAMALGADWCNSARGYMFAIGCIQAQSCHTNRCPAGIATQDPRRMKALDVTDKTQRVARFHRNTLKALGELVGAAGLSHPSEFLPYHFMFREKDNAFQDGNEVFEDLPEGFLLTGSTHPDLQAWLDRWNRASAETFEPLRMPKSRFAS